MEPDCRKQRDAPPVELATPIDLAGVSSRRSSWARPTRSPRSSHTSTATTQHAADLVCERRSLGCTRHRHHRRWQPPSRDRVLRRQSQVRQDQGARHDGDGRQPPDLPSRRRATERTRRDRIHSRRHRRLRQCRLCRARPCQRCRAGAHAAPGAGLDDGFTSYKAQVGDPPRTRWGDYGAAAVDGNSIWIASEYIAQTCTLDEWLTAPIGRCDNTGASATGAHTSPRSHPDREQRQESDPRITLPAQHLGGGGLIQ